MKYFILVMSLAILGCSTPEEKVLKSPMPELDSVDDVLLTPEEEARAVEEARVIEKITKPPSRPKD